MFLNPLKKMETNSAFCVFSSAFPTTTGLLCSRLQNSVTLLSQISVTAGRFLGLAGSLTDLCSHLGPPPHLNLVLLCIPPLPSFSLQSHTHPLASPHLLTGPQSHHCAAVPSSSSDFLQLNMEMGIREVF